MHGDSKRNGRGRTLITQIAITLPEEGNSDRKRRKELEPVECRIERCMELVDSGHASKAAWKYLIWVNNSLVRKYDEGRINRREMAILHMIQPVIEKYGLMSPDTVEMRAELHTTARAGKEAD